MSNPDAQASDAAPAAPRSQTDGPPDALVVLITAPAGAAEAELARTLVDERLVACVNLIPGVRSLYRWQGEVQDDAESLLLCKTTPDRYAALEARVRELHPYEVPEIIALPLVHGSAPYLAWLAEQTRVAP